MQFERRKPRSTNAVQKKENFDLLMQFERRKLRSTNAVRKTKTSIYSCSSKDKNFDLLMQLEGQKLRSTNECSSKVKNFNQFEISKVENSDIL